jgi:hypothetical protein
MTTIVPMEYTEYVAPDGSIFSFDDNDKLLVSEEGTGLPPIEYFTQQGPQQHGETLIDYRLKPRTIQMLLRQDACNRFDYWTNRLSLLNGIRPNKHTFTNFGPGYLRKRFPDGSVKNINVIIEQGPTFSPRDITKWDEWAFTETLRFIAHDPVYYDPVKKAELWENLIELAVPAEWLLPFSLPLVFDPTMAVNTRYITCVGTWFSYPTITITGPAVGFSIANLDTGEVITLDYTIGSGEIVTISLEYGNKTVTNDSGTNLIGTVYPTTDLATFHIAPTPEVLNGINTLVVAATGVDGNTTVLLEYYTKYIGY